MHTDPMTTAFPVRRNRRSALGLAALSIVAVVATSACGDDDTPDETDVEVITSDVTASSVVTVDSEVTVGTIISSEVQVVDTVTEMSEVEVINTETDVSMVEVSNG